MAPTFVPYRGSGPLLNDVMAGTVPVMIDTLSAAIGHIRSGRIKALAVSAPARSPALPDVPTFAELGAGDATGMNWFGFCAPAGLPVPIAARWLTELRAALALPAVAERLAGLGVEGTNIDPGAMTELVGREVARWREVIRANNVTAG
jgi:tripartite-type tricarboxylate transporter receptor subunit TctC